MKKKYFKDSQDILSPLNWKKEKPGKLTQKRLNTRTQQTKCNVVFGSDSGTERGY